MTKALTPNRFGYVTVRDIVEAGRGTPSSILRAIRKGKLPAVLVSNIYWIPYEAALTVRGPYKITKEQVEQIRALDGTMSRREIAERFGIDPSYVTYICQGKRRRER